MTSPRALLVIAGLAGGSAEALPVAVPTGPAGAGLAAQFAPVDRMNEPAVFILADRSAGGQGQDGQGYEDLHAGKTEANDQCYTA
jgi:hypothetical protein